MEHYGALWSTMDHYGALWITMDHYGSQKEAENLDGEKTFKQGMISVDVCTEWQTYKQYLVKPLKETMKLQ